ncbi:MAG: hypothetical protein GWN58_27570 [Anaerolineae bacterium]|nr:hypothetical protein [Anaerolineae bacterium]
MSYVPAVQISTKYVLPIRELLPTGQPVYNFKVVDSREVTGRKVANKYCLANLCPELIENTTMVRLIDVDQMGQRLPQNLRLQALVIALHSFEEPMVPLWTQSGGKNGTYYFVPAWVFEKLVDSLGIDRDTGAERFASYIGLLYSDVDPKGRCVAVPAMWDEPKHGEDGNCVISRALWGTRSTQSRGIVLRGGDRYPMALEKGIKNPLASMDGNPRGAYLNSSQVKVAHPDVGPHQQFILVQTIVNDKPIRVPATWELIELLQDVPEVRKVLKGYVAEAVAEICEMLKEGDRVKLLKRLGQLRIDEYTGELCQTDRNVLSALRANFPWCEELEARLGRVFVDELVSRIAPSGGVFAWSYLAIQHDKIGARSCKWEDAKCFAYRVPCTSIDNVVPFAKVLRNGKVHPDVMAAMDGDSDGDRINVISDPAIVDLFKKHRLDFRAGHKPDKRRAESPVSPDRQIDLAIQTREDLGGVGRLTMAMHTNLVAGRLKEAANAGYLAQLCPMLLKWQVLVDGLPARDVIRIALSKRMPVASWRKKQREAKELESPRELYHLGIRKNASIIDYCWNCMVRTVREWVRENPLKPLSLPSVARLSWEAHPEMRLSGADMRWQRAVVQMWGEYWAENYGKDISHAALFQTLEDLGEKASVSSLVALLLWQPKTGVSTGFALKWHALGRRWEDVLGLRDEVKDWVIAHNVDYEVAAALNAAIREAMGYGFAERVA